MSDDPRCIRCQINKCFLCEHRDPRAQLKAIDDSKREKRGNSRMRSRSKATSVTPIIQTKDNDTGQLKKKGLEDGSKKGCCC